MPRIELQSALPWGLVVAVLLILSALLITYGIWMRSLPRAFRGWIIALRTSLLVVVLLLLFDPRIEWTRKVLMPPRIGIFLDNSLSMANHPEASPTTVFSQAASIVEWADEHNYQPVILTFGEKLDPKTDLRFEYLPDERLTDFSLLEEICQTGDLQAAFLFSDGVATSGIDPGAITSSPRMPIFTLGVGDTTTGLDLSILEVHYPLSLLDQEQSTIQVVVRGKNAADKRSRLFVFHEDQLIHSEQIRITSQEYIRSFETSVVGRLDAPHFRVELMVLPEEANIDNNRREFRIDVLPGRRRITLLTGALSANTPLISQVAKRTRHAVVNHLVFLRGVWRGDESLFWSTPQDLVVLDNYPTTTLPEGYTDRLLAKLRRDKTPVLVVEGPDNLNREFVRMMRSLGLQVAAEDEGQGSLYRLTPVPQPELKGLSRMTPGRYSVDFPPAPLVHFLEPRANRGMKALVSDEQDRLVISYGEASGIKRGVLLLPALAATNLKLNRTAWKDYLGDVLQALVEWQLEPEGFSPYVIQPDRRQYQLGEKVLLRGIMRDRAGTKLLQPILTVEIQGAESTAAATLNYNFESGEYEGEFWPGEPGSYRFRVYDEAGTSEEAARPGFQVQVGRVELESLVQNRYGLKRLAQSTGGRYTELQSVEQLISQLAYTTRTVNREYYLSLWQFRYLWVALVLLLGSEWILRRIAGLI